MECLLKVFLKNQPRLFLLYWNRAFYVLLPTELYLITTSSRNIYLYINRKSTIRLDAKNNYSGQVANILSLINIMNHIYIFFNMYFIVLHKGIKGLKKQKKIMESTIHFLFCSLSYAIFHHFSYRIISSMDFLGRCLGVSSPYPNVMIPHTYLSFGIFFISIQIFLYANLFFFVRQFYAIFKITYTILHQFIII